MSNLITSEDRDGLQHDEELIRELEASLDRLQAFADQAWAENTIRAYKSDWEHFSAWCMRHERRALPAAVETVGLYLGSIVDSYTLATIERRLASISSMHKEKNHESPASVSSGPLRNVWRGIVRDKSRQQDKAQPLMVEDLRLIVQNLPRKESGGLTLSSLRDRSILLVGWAGALRRSEIVGLTFEDLDFVPGEGVNIFIARSKTDQEGEGLLKGIPYGTHPDTCPVTALRTWLQAADIDNGPVFRRFYRGGSIGKTALTPQYVSIILKEHAERVGLDTEALSAHSLRSGFITQAIRAGKPERRVKEHSGHKSWETFNGYVKQAATFQENPAEGIGL
jgi:site-specific recombinase XerD